VCYIARVDNLAFELEETPSAYVRPEIHKVSYTHHAMIDAILMNPTITQTEMAKQFGYSQTGICIIVNSDAFKERMAERKAELLDPQIRASLQERLDTVARRSLDRIMDRLDSPGHIKDADLVSFAKLGVGDRNNRVAAPQTQNNLYVVALPAPAPNSQAWLDNRSDKTPRVLPIAEEVTPGLNGE
jgi:hypothetical protein